MFSPYDDGEIKRKSSEAHRSVSQQKKVTQSHIVIEGEPMEKLIVIFVSVLLAGLGEKTQLATILYTADKEVSRTALFLTTAGALIISTAIAVIAGERLTSLLSSAVLHAVTGSGFVLIGFWMLLQMLQ
jgi:putative Ca2+/H+ antiporter (TMEM165/GDT1 family)